MKKLFAVTALFCGMISTAAFATEIHYYSVSGTTNVGGQAYCSSVLPGSTYFGVRMGFGGSYFIACAK